VALTPTDLDNAEIDLQTTSIVANSKTLAGGAADTTITRLGDTADTLNGRLKKLGYIPPIAYAGGIVFTALDNVKTVDESGSRYAPKVGELPFTTSGTWIGDDEDKFYLIEGARVPQLSAEFADISNLVGGTSLNAGSVDWSDYEGRNVSVVVNNTTSNAGAATYTVVNSDPGNLSTLIAGIWVGVNHDLGGGYYAKLNYSGEINVLTCGACSNALVDSEAFNAAFAASLSVLSPAGEYRLSETVYYGSRQTFRGEGNATNIISTVVAGNVFENSAQCFAFDFRDFRISGGGSETGGFVCTTTFEGFSLTNVSLVGIGGKALWLTDCFVGTLTNVLCEGNFVSEWGAYLEGVTNTNFVGCRFRQTLKTGSGVGITSGIAGGSYDLTFYGCLFESNLAAGMRAESCFGLTVLGGYFEANNREVNFPDTPTTRFSNVELTTIVTGGECSNVRLEPGFWNGQRVGFLVYSDLEVNGLTIGGNRDQRWGEYAYQYKRYAVDTSATDSKLNLIGSSIADVKIGVSSATFIASDAASIGQTYSMSLYDTDNIEHIATFTTVTGSETGAAIAANLVADLGSATGVTVTDNLDGSFSISTAASGIWDFEDVSLLAYSVTDNSGKVIGGEATASLSRKVQLFYYNAGGSSIEGTIPATITSSRTTLSSHTKTCTFEIDSIDVSGLISAGLSSRIVGIMPAVGRFSVGFFTAQIDHGGTSASGVLQFSLKSRTNNSLDFRLLKDKATAGSSNIARISDIDGVTSLDGSFSYF
jgi:hypothetical protein